MVEKSRALMEFQTPHGDPAFICVDAIVGLVDAGGPLECTYIYTGDGDPFTVAGKVRSVVNRLIEYGVFRQL